MANYDAIVIENSVSIPFPVIVQQNSSDEPESQNYVATVQPVFGQFITELDGITQ